MSFSLPGCVSQVAPWYEVDPGEGRLLFIRHYAEKAGPRRVLEVHTRAGTTALPVDEPRIARWLDPRTILVLADGSTQEAGAAGPQLIRVDVITGATTPVREARGVLDLEPSADGGKLARVRNLGGNAGRALVVGDPNLAGGRAGITREGYEEPRWGPEPSRLVARRMMPPLSGGPRLHLLSTQSSGAEPLQQSAAFGVDIHPMWWDATGVWARHERGLVRCDPRGGCDVVYSPAEGQRVADGRPIGGGEALLLIARDGNADALPHAVHRVTLATGEGHIADLLQAGEYFTDIDWIALPGSP